MANIKNIGLNGTSYTLFDATAVHTVDSALSSSSTNPVQNKVVKEYVDDAIQNEPYIHVIFGFGTLVLWENFAVQPTSYSELLANDDFKMALARPVIIDLGTGNTIIQGLIVNMNGIPSSNHWSIAFPDAVMFNGTLTNGIEGDLAYSEGDGWFLDNFDSHTPGFKSYTDDAISNLSLVSTQVAANATEAATPASGDGLIFADSDDSNKLKRMTSGFDTTNTTSFLRQDGTWAAPPSVEAPVARIFHGKCSTSAGTAAKVVTCPQFLSSDFVTGAIVFVTFTATNSATAANVTLNVNSTGAKGVRYMRNAAESSLPGNGYLRANMTYRFVYNGTYWVCDTDYDADTTTRLTFRSYRVSAATGGGKLVAYQFCALDNNNDVIPFNSITHETAKNTTYNKALMTASFNPFRGILYYAGTTEVAAGSVRDANEFASVLAFDVRYSLNINSSGTAGTTALTAYDPVYLKALYNTTTRLATLTTDLSSNNYLKRSSIVQSLPSSDPSSGLPSGQIYIYILLGQAYSKYQIDMYDNKTVYFWNSKAGMMTPFEGIIEANYAAQSHTHGSDQISVSAVSQMGTVTTGDRIIIGTSSLEAPAALAFDTTNTTTYLRKDGTWATPASGTTYILTSDSYYGFTAGTPTGTDLAAGIVAQDVYNDFVDIIATGEKSIVIIDDAKLFDYDSNDSVKAFVLSEVNESDGEIAFYYGGDAANYTPETLIINNNDAYRLIYATHVPHFHGSMNNLGQMTDTAASVASSDKLLIASSGNSNAIKTADIAFDTTNTTDYLRKDGTWATPSGGGGGGSTDEVPYVTCSTAVGTAAKTVDYSGFTFAAGKRLYVLFTNGNTATQPSLNVNGTGAKYLRYNNNYLRDNPSYSATSMGCYIAPGSVVEVIASGDYWIIVSGWNTQILATNGSANRAASINRSISYPALEYMIAKNNSTGAPAGYAKIIHCNYDTNNIYACQLAMGITDGRISGTQVDYGFFQYRTQIGSGSGSSSWSQWYDVPLVREGTMTITDNDSTAPSSDTWNYYKVGKLVTVWGQYTGTSTTATTLSGFRYTPSASSIECISFNSAVGGIAMGVYNVQVGITSGSTSVKCSCYTNVTSSVATFSAASWLQTAKAQSAIIKFSYIADQ